MPVTCLLYAYYMHSLLIKIAFVTCICYYERNPVKDSCMLKMLLNLLLKLISRLFPPQKNDCGANQTQPAVNTTVYPLKVDRAAYMRWFDDDSLTLQHLENRKNLLRKVNAFFADHPDILIVSSGYRSPAHNKKIGGAPKSAHVTCEAIDLSDPDNSLKRYIVKNRLNYEKLGLYFEHFSRTSTWVHIQTRPTKRRFFLP
jgi:hypothetical protein